LCNQVVEFPIHGPGLPPSNDLKLHEALHPSVAGESIWVRYLACADLRYSAKHSTKRRAMMFDPGNELDLYFIFTSGLDLQFVTVFELLH
jgi:hypothetical protein